MINKPMRRTPAGGTPMRPASNKRSGPASGNKTSRKIVATPEARQRLNQKKALDQKTNLDRRRRSNKQVGGSARPMKRTY